MTESRSIAPLSARRKMMEEPTLGAGSFLDHALALNPNREEPFVYRHFTDQRGNVVLKGHSLVDLAAIRDQYARWYWANGVRPGDPVGVLVAEGIEPLFHYLAITSIGAIPAMVNDAMRPASAKRYLDHVGVVGIVSDDPTALVAVYRGNGQHRPRFIVPTSELRAHDPASGGLPAVYPYRHTADEVVALIHSSGTTGTPKSTMLGHRQFWIGKEVRMLRFPAEPYDRLLSLMPHTHAGGLSYFMTAVLLGLPIVTMAGWRREVVEPVMKAFRPTMVASFPRTFVELATGTLPIEAAANVHTWFNTGDGAHYGHIRRLVTLGQRPAGLVKPWLLPDGKADQDALPGSQFIDGLGSSEMGMALFGQVTSPETERNDRCIGKPLAVVERAAVLDEQGREQPDGVAGLLGVKTPTRTPGYWNDPEMTRRFELAGYWLTGDVVRKDAEGRFYHLDRTVDVIDTAEGPVYSLPIEEVLLADCSDCIMDCAVVGVPGSNWSGQRPVATVRLQPGIDAPPASVLLERANAALAAATLAPVAALIVAREAADFPTGVTGKVLKRELRTRLATVFTDEPRMSAA
jgi:acyl-coenzyme A synthetase/AMP-(fatty) acid ligase